jgi:hypothetical protein
MMEMITRAITFYMTMKLKLKTKKQLKIILALSTCGAEVNG